MIKIGPLSTSTSTSTSTPVTGTGTGTGKKGKKKSTPISTPTSTPTPTPTSTPAKNALIKEIGIQGLKMGAGICRHLPAWGLKATCWGFKITCITCCKLPYRAARTGIPIITGLARKTIEVPSSVLGGIINSSSKIITVTSLAGTALRLYFRPAEFVAKVAQKRVYSWIPEFCPLKQPLSWVPSVGIGLAVQNVFLGIIKNFAHPFLAVVPDVTTVLSDSVPALRSLASGSITVLSALSYAPAIASGLTRHLLKSHYADTVRSVASFALDTATFCATPVISAIPSVINQVIDLTQTLVSMAAQSMNITAIVDEIVNNTSTNSSDTLSNETGHSPLVQGMLNVTQAMGSLAASAGETTLDALIDPLQTALKVSSVFVCALPQTLYEIGSAALFSYPRETALLIASSAAIYKLVKIPKPLPVLSSYCRILKQGQGASKTSISSQVQKYLSQLQPYIPSQFERYASQTQKYLTQIRQSIPSLREKQLPKPIELCVNDYNHFQVNQTLLHLKKGELEHMLIEEREGSETGKIIEKIREELHCSYINLPASRIAFLVSAAMGYLPQAHMTFIKEMKEWIQRSSVPTLLHITELEDLCTAAESGKFNRDGSIDQRTKIYQELLRALKDLAKEEKNLLIIGETRHPHRISFDFKHLLRRSIHIDLPDEATRIKLLQRAMDRKLPDIPERNTCLNDEAIATIAKRTPGLNSDLLTELVCDLCFRRKCSNNHCLTEELVKEVTDEKIEDYYHLLSSKKPQLADKFHAFNAPPKKHTRIEAESSPPLPVFNQKLQEQIRVIVDWTRNIRKNKGELQNLLLYGEAGTGKTLIAEKIAKESGFNYISIKGGDLAQFISAGTHLTALEELFQFIENSSEPTILFIDEMDVLAEDRTKMDHAHREILNTLLAYTGTPSKKCMIIGTTNRLKSMDSAVLSRMDNKLHIGLPEYASRFSILSNLITQKMVDDKGLEIPERKNCLNQAAINSLAAKTEGMSGRTLHKLVTKLQSKRDSLANQTLTEEIVDAVTYTTLCEERASCGESSSLRTKLFDFRHFTLARIRRAFRRMIWASLRLS